MPKYKGFMEHNGVFRPIEQFNEFKRLPSGVYELQVTQEGTLLFEESKTTHDDLVPIPDGAFDQVHKEMEHFLKKETKKAFESLGFVYKRSALLFGAPGTGKTSLINRVIHSTIESGGLVLLNPDPRALPYAYSILDSLQPDDMCLVVFEELDKLIRSFEGDLLNILDGEVQKSNIMYLATTNYIQKVPARILRPGRFSSVIEVQPPSLVAREFYLKTKLSDKEASEIASKTEGLTIDELKEVVLSTKCFGNKLSDVIDRLRGLKELSDVNEFEDEDIWDMDFSRDRDIGALKRAMREYEEVRQGVMRK
jgi:SpoVK/Ycf46/Vps4 family AAA+-type ATPase